MITVKTAIEVLKAQGTETITCHALGYEGRYFRFSVDDERLIPYYDYEVSSFSSAGRYGTHELNETKVGCIVYLAEGLSDKWMKKAP
jgi:hypothetical protein